MNFHTNNNANAMMFQQPDSDQFDDEDYSMFLAYGDTFRDLPPEPTGEGSNQFWENKATELLERAGGEKLFKCLSIRSSINQRKPTWRYQGDSDFTTEDPEG